MLFTTAEQSEWVASRLIGHTIEIRYNSEDPSTWYLPAKRIGGWKIITRDPPNTRDLELSSK